LLGRLVLRGESIDAELLRARDLGGGAGRDERHEREQRAGNDESTIPHGGPPVRTLMVTHGSTVPTPFRWPRRARPRRSAREGGPPRPPPRPARATPRAAVP